MNGKPYVVAQIVARGGGSTVYRKNLYSLLGKPVILRAVEILQATEFIDAVCIWTEDEEIKSIGREAGAVVLDRPKSMVHYSSGFFTLEEWAHNRHTQINENLDRPMNYSVFFNCNNILIRPTTLNDMFRTLTENRDTASSIQTLTRVEPELCIINPDDNRIFPFWNDPERTPSQHPSLFRLGGVSISDPSRTRNSRYSTMYHLISKEESFDFQNMDDIPLAEYYLQNMETREELPCK